MVKRRKFLGALIAPTLVSSAAESLEAVPAARPVSAPPWPVEGDPDYWDRIRDQFYFPRDEAFFNTGTIGAVPRSVLERVIEDMRTLQATVTRWDYTERTPNWFSGYSPELPLREKMGRAVHVPGRDIAVTQNATFGMNFVAHGLDLMPGDEVIQTDQEHPGGTCGWMLREKRDGIVIKRVHVPVPARDPDELVELFAQTFTARTRVLAVPHIISPSGMVLPVKRLTALAHERGCLTVIDGAQAVGQIPVDIADIGCDAYFSSPHKWLLAPPGNGLFYLRPDRENRVWTTLCSSEWDNHQDGLYRFMQYGTGNKSLQVGLDAALDFYFRIGPARWDVIEVHRRATSTAATLFLDTLQRRLPFPLRALQVDGGSEFAAVFEQACQQRGVRLFVLPPRSPKLNGRVERANRTHTEEFYEITPCPLQITQLNQELRDWERTDNTVRPHQALGYLTPHQFLAQSSSQRKELMCH